MGSAGSAAPRKFEGKSSFGRKYWSLEEKHRKFENDHIRKYLCKEQKAGNIGSTIFDRSRNFLAQLQLNRNK